MWLMPGGAHISFIVAIEVAMPACGSFMIDEAIAAPPIVVLAAGVGDIAAGTIVTAEMALVAAMATFAIVEVDVMQIDMPFKTGKLAMSISVALPPQDVYRHGISEDQ